MSAVKPDKKSKKAPAKRVMVTVALTEEDHDRFLGHLGSGTSKSEIIRRALALLVSDGGEARISPEEARIRTGYWLHTDRPVLDAETLVDALDALAVLANASLKVNDRNTLSDIAKRFGVTLKPPAK